jgi:predicted nucleic acid-binding protein
LYDAIPNISDFSAAETTAAELKTEAREAIANEVRAEADDRSQEGRDVAVYVETGFLTALVKDDDWLQDATIRALEERDDIHTSILAYAEVPVSFSDREAAEYEIDAPRAIINLFELVPIVLTEHEDAVLAAAAFLDEYDLTPFDVLHAELVTTGDGRVLSTEQDYDAVGLTRTPLEPKSSE